MMQLIFKLHIKCNAEMSHLQSSMGFYIGLHDYYSSGLQLTVTLRSGFSREIKTGGVCVCVDKQIDQWID